VGKSPNFAIIAWGEQIERIFGCWVIVYFGQVVLQITEVALIIGQK
jgi:hypothetical protein